MSKSAGVILETATADERGRVHGIAEYLYFGSPESAFKFFESFSLTLETLMKVVYTKLVNKDATVEYTLGNGTKVCLKLINFADSDSNSGSYLGLKPEDARFNYFCKTK